MGDTGSNLLGYLLGAIAVQGALKTNAVVALFFPLVVLAVPILDTGFVIAKRIKYRQPIYRADRWHFHHRMANIGFSQRRTLAYLYGWALVMAGLALALRFVPYSDDHGNFDPFWTAVIVVCLVAALAASFYLVITLEILKLRTTRFRELFGTRGAAPAEAEVDAGVARELETGSFAGGRPGDRRARGARSARDRGPRGRSGCYKRVTSSLRRGAVFLYSQRRRRVLALFRDGRLSRPYGSVFWPHCLVASSTPPMTETPPTRAVATMAGPPAATGTCVGSAAAVPRASAAGTPRASLGGTALVYARSRRL